jgi:hypothetical protein
MGARLASASARRPPAADSSSRDIPPHPRNTPETKLRIMLETFTMETFQPRIGELFHIVAEDGGRLPTKLTEVSPWGPGASRDRPRVPFSLIFHTIAAAPVLPQQIYRMENENMEGMEIFLTPIGPDEHGMRYEAVFT